MDQHQQQKPPKLLPNKCACANLSPVRLPDDERGGERYRCYYCHFRWRIKEDHILPCKFCESLSVDIKQPKNGQVICKMCGSKFPQADYKVHRYVCLW